MSDGVPATTFNQVAQVGHFAAGLAVIWGSEVLFRPRSLLIPMGVLAAVAAVKEFWYDQNYETPVVRGSNLEDWLFYQFGGLVAMLCSWSVVWLRH